MAQLSDGPPRGDPPGVLPGLDDRADRRRSPDRRGHREIAPALRRSGVAAQSAGNGGDTMTQFGYPEVMSSWRRSVCDRGTPPTSSARCRAMNAASTRRTWRPARGAGAAVAELSGIPALLAHARPRGGRGARRRGDGAAAAAARSARLVLDKVEWRAAPALGGSRTVALPQPRPRAGRRAGDRDSPGVPRLQNGTTQADGAALEMTQGLPDADQRHHQR